MGRSCFLSILLVSSLLVLCFSHVEGFGRKVMETVEHEDSTFRVEESTVGKSRRMIEVMDYSDPGPNTNPKSGYIFSPPPQV